MNIEEQEHIDENRAITNAYGENERITPGSVWGDITWAEWCEREMIRINGKHPVSPARIARGFGRIWLTRD